VYRAQLYGLTLLFVQSSSATACETGATLLDHWKRRQRTAALFMGKRHRANAIENSVTSTSNVASLTLIKAIQRIRRNLIKKIVGVGARLEKACAQGDKGIELSSSFVDITLP